MLYINIIHKKMFFLFLQNVLPIHIYLHGFVFFQNNLSSHWTQKTGVVRF